MDMRKYESPSSCYMYDHCPRKYKFRYVEKIPEASNIYADFGIRFEDIVYPRWNTGRSPEHDDPKICNMLTKMFDDENVKKMPEALLIQQKIDVQCGGSRFLGYTDIIHTDGSITDLKTSKRKWGKDKLGGTQQHVAYSFGCVKSGFIENIFPVIFRYLIITTVPPHNIQIIEMKITEKDIRDFEKSFSERIKNIESNIFPCKKTYECNWCSYKNICPSW